MTNGEESACVTIADVETCISSILRSADPVTVKYIRDVASGSGKRLRPKLVIQFAKLFGASDKEKVVYSASSTELLHTASLIHDDVVDGASTRRGKHTLNSEFGNETAVLVGDYLLALLFAKLTELKDFTLLEMTLRSARELGAGAIEEIANRRNLNITEDAYYRIIALKTGSLFKLSCEMGAYVGQASEIALECIRNYGVLFGMAFQIIDDILDLSATEEVALKPTFNDLREGRITLPIIHALSRDRASMDSLIREFIKDSVDVKREMRVILAELGSFSYATSKAIELMENAGECLTRISDEFKAPELLEEIHALQKSVIDRVGINAQLKFQQS